MKSNRIASIIIESNRIVRSVNRSGPNVNTPMQTPYKWQPYPEIHNTFNNPSI